MAPIMLMYVLAGAKLLARLHGTRAGSGLTGRQGGRLLRRRGFWRQASAKVFKKRAACALPVYISEVFYTEI